MRTFLLLAALSAASLAQQPQTSAPASPAAQAPSTDSAAPAQTATAPAPPGMSPADAYLYAMQPFTNARTAPDDFTEADRWALGIGIARAREQCELLMKQPLQGEDLLAMGKLCVFGQDFQPAKQFLTTYLALPQPKAPEVGQLLLTRAFLGLRSVASAESQIESLLNLYPYDASIHLGIDMVIDAAEASDYSEDLAFIPRLNELQLPHTLDALAHGASLSGNGDSVDAAMLVRDALRCADADRRTWQAEAAQKIVAGVMGPISADPLAHGAEATALENILARYGMNGRSSPVRAFHGAELMASGTAISRVVPLYDSNPAAHRIVTGSGSHTITRMLDDRILVLVFSLAGPASSGTISKTMDRLAQDHVTPGLKVVAVTSWAANIGVETPDPKLLAALRTFRTELPAKLPVFIVPDSELKPFAIDFWPAAILFDGRGRILWLNTLSGSDGSVHQMAREIESPGALSMDQPQ